MDKIANDVISEITKRFKSFNPNVETVQEINIGLVNFNSPKQLMEVLNSCDGNFKETGIDILQQKLRDNKDAPYTTFLKLLINIFLNLILSP